MFFRSKNALTRGPGLRLNLTPGVGLILMIEKRCAHAQGSSSTAGPLAICCRPMGDYKILCSWLLSEKTAVATALCIVLGCGLPTVKFFQSRHTKKAGLDCI
jgi:hypothetical protein